MFVKGARSIPGTGRSPRLLFSLTRSELPSALTSALKGREPYSHSISEAAGDQTMADGGREGRGWGMERRLGLKNLKS